jgi:glutamate racemase
VIGLFDSGLGGLTVVRRVRDRLPQADMLFFADQAHVPYGDRTAQELQHLLERNIHWLDERGVDAIVMACNTSCAIADAYGWPAARGQIFDLIDAAAAALQQIRARRIGVVATTATVRSGAYGRRIRSRLSDAQVWEVAAPALVPFVEAGKIDDPVTSAAVASACAQLPDRLDAVVLACTHYPVLEAHFCAALGQSVRLIDPALVQAQRVAEFVMRRGLDREGAATRYVTSGDCERFRTSIIRLMGEPHPIVLESVPPDTSSAATVPLCEQGPALTFEFDR